MRRRVQQQVRRRARGLGTAREPSRLLFGSHRRFTDGLRNGAASASEPRVGWARHRSLSLFQPKTATIAYNAIAPMMMFWAAALLKIRDC